LGCSLIGILCALAPLRETDPYKFSLAKAQSRKGDHKKERTNQTFFVFFAPFVVKISARDVV
jgi:hypothetical protein